MRYNSAQEMADEMILEEEMRIMQFKKRLEEETDEAFRKSDAEALEEFAVYQTEYLSKLFYEAVTEFYGAYTPVLYERQGNVSSQSGGLYELLTASDGTVYQSVDDMVNPEKMHKDRKGGDLFTKVFVDGWHGGAESGDGHPPGKDPYYRKPHPYYTQWGKKAKQTKSPRSIIDDKWYAAEKKTGDLYLYLESLLDEKDKKVIESVYSKIVPRVIKEVGL